eukprot:scaffold201164_cov18-Prasinocladus_malaysianus.AAC.1
MLFYWTPRQRHSGPLNLSFVVLPLSVLQNMVLSMVLGVVRVGVAAGVVCVLAVRKQAESES